MYISELSIPYISLPLQDPGTPLSIPGMLPPINTNRMPPTGLGGSGSSPLASPVTTPSGQLSPSLAGGNYCTQWRKNFFSLREKICQFSPLAPFGKNYCIHNFSAINFFVGMISIGNFLKFILLNYQRDEIWSPKLLPIGTYKQKSKIYF